MSRHHVTITPEESGYGRVEIDGHDISDAVTHADIRIHPAHGTKVTLGLLTLLGPIEAEGKSVILPPETVQALLALGWTPPQDDAEPYADVLDRAQSATRPREDHTR